MSETTELLDFIYKNAKMGEVTLPWVIGMASRPDLRTALSSQLTEYCAIGEEAADAIRRGGRRPRKPGQMQSAMAEAALHMTTLTNHSSRHIAEMMVKGSTMGTVQISKRINAYQYSADEDALQLAERLRQTEENNIEQMKAFL